MAMQEKVNGVMAQTREWPELVLWKEDEIRRLQNESVEAEELSRVLEKQHEDLKAILHSTAEDLRQQLDRAKAENLTDYRKLRQAKQQLTRQQQKLQQYQMHIRAVKRPHELGKELKVTRSFTISKEEFINIIG